MSTIRYIPSSLASQVASSKILCIYASAHPATGVGAPGAAGNPKTNHWVLYCAISQAASLRIDPSPSGPNLSIVLIITKKDYLISDNAVKSFQLVTSYLTVQIHRPHRGQELRQISIQRWRTGVQILAL